MKLNLLACHAPRPDNRAITKYILEITSKTSKSVAQDLTNRFLDGDAVTIEIEDRNSASALRILRKLSIDYDIIE